MRLCNVANCPAAAAAGSRCYGPHETARTAKELGLGPDKNGYGAATCAKCWRRFRTDDYVLRVTVTRRVRATTAAAWQHANCSPAVHRPTPKEIRESPKPLLESAADTPHE